MDGDIHWNFEKHKSAAEFFAFLFYLHKQHRPDVINPGDGSFLLDFQWKGNCDVDGRRIPLNCLQHHLRKYVAFGAPIGRLTIGAFLYSAFCYCTVKTTLPTFSPR